MVTLSDIFSGGALPEMEKKIAHDCSCIREAETRCNDYVVITKCNEDYLPYRRELYPKSRGGSQDIFR